MPTTTSYVSANYNADVDIDKKLSVFTDTGAHVLPSLSHSNDYFSSGPPSRPVGWLYRSPRIGSLKLPWYASPLAQLLIVSFVCFLCPGMFNALNGLGGGGIGNATAANNANCALYSTFAVVGFFGGTITNALGVRAGLSFGGLGYFLYAASFLAWKHTQNKGFVVFAGAMLGVCAGLLWTAQGAVMMSYPPEQLKGRYIFIFWMIFNLGAVLGSLVPLGQNVHNKANAVGDGTYIAFLILMFLGSILAWFLVHPSKVIRQDCSRVILMKHPTWKSELLGLVEVLRTDWLTIVPLFPMFFVSNWFYTYQFNDVNLARFDIRSRALNNVLYWLAQIAGALAFGALLDISMVRRSVRAKIGLVLLFVLTMAVWGGGYALQRLYTRADQVKTDWDEAGFGGPSSLFVFYGFYDAAWQTTVYWLMGALTNNGRKTAFYAGFYKGLQSAGAAVAWRLDTLGISYMASFASCWALLAGGLACAAPVIWLKVMDHVSVEEDLKFSDATIEDIVAPPTGKMTELRRRISSVVSEKV